MYSRMNSDKPAGDVIPLRPSGPSQSERENAKKKKKPSEIRLLRGMISTMEAPGQDDEGNTEAMWNLKPGEIRRGFG